MTKDFEDDLIGGWRIRIGYLLERKTRDVLDRKPPELHIELSFVPTETGGYHVVKLSKIELVDGLKREWELDDDSKRLANTQIDLRDDEVDVEIVFILPGSSKIVDGEAVQTVENMAFFLNIEIDGSAVKRSCSFTWSRAAGSFSPLEWKQRDE